MQVGSATRPESSVAGSDAVDDWTTRVRRSTDTRLFWTTYQLAADTERRTPRRLAVTRHLQGGTKTDATFWLLASFKKTKSICNDFGNLKSVKLASPCLIVYLLSHHSRQRERLNAMELSICLSVCRQNAETWFSQKLSNLELWRLFTTYRKSYMGFSKNPILDP